MKPYYQDDLVTIYHGDCREIAPDLSADLVLTDPPYGVGIAEWDDAFLLPPFVEGATVIGIMPGVANIGACPPMLHGLPYRWTLAAHLRFNTAHGAFGLGRWIPCLVYARPEAKLYQQISDSESFTLRQGVDDARGLTDHPSPKPLVTTRWMLQSLPGAVVMDPFMGSGTTLVAAKSLSRKAIGIEREERWCEQAAARCSQEVLGLV